MPHGPSTSTRPDSASAGSVTRNVSSEDATQFGSGTVTPPILTAVACESPLPYTLIASPTLPLSTTSTNCSAGCTVNAAVLVAVPTLPLTSRAFHAQVVRSLAAAPLTSQLNVPVFAIPDASISHGPEGPVRER